MPSFDVVSKTDLAEVDNALSNIKREIATRFDFKDSKCKIERLEDKLTVHADDQMKLKQIHELLKVHMVRRKVEPSALDFKDVEAASGNTVRQEIVVKQGIDREVAKRIVKEIKDSKRKIQAAVQGDELRISGTKRDELQDAIALIKGMKIEQPLQFVNFRD